MCIRVGEFEYQKGKTFLSNEEEMQFKNGTKLNQSKIKQKRSSYHTEV